MSWIIAENRDKQEEIRLNDIVMVTTMNRSRYRGVVRFIGVTKFASGTWYGVELDSPDGRNNGSVQGMGNALTFELTQKLVHFEDLTKQ